MGLFGSDARPSSRVQNIDNSQTQGTGSRAAQFRAGGNKGPTAQADAGAIALSGSGNTVNLSSIDPGAFQLAGDVVGQAIHAQSSLAEAALSANAGLAETKATGGENLLGRKTVVLLLG